MPTSDNINPLDKLIDQDTLLSVSFDKREVCKDLLGVFQERYPHLSPKYMIVNPDLRSMVDFVFIFESNNPQNSSMSLYHVFVAHLFTVMGTNGFKVIRNSRSTKLLDIYFDELFKASATIPAAQFPQLIGQMEYETYALQRPIYDPAKEEDIKGDYYVKNTKRLIYEKGYSDKLEESVLKHVLECWPEEITVTNWYYSQRLSVDPKDEFYFTKAKCLPAFFRNISRLVSQFAINRQIAKSKNTK